LVASLAGCAGSGSILAGAAANPSGTAAGLFGIPAATVSTQLTQELVGIQAVAAQLQLLKAQLDGNLPIVQTPPIVSPIPTPVTPVPPPVVVVPPTPIPSPDGPIVTPNSLGPHASRGVHRRMRQQLAQSFWQWNPPSFTLTTDLLAVPLR